MTKSAAPMLHEFWIGTQPIPADRQVIRVTRAAAEKIQSLTRGQIFQCRDYATKKIVRLRRADCGLDCFCALEFATEGRAA